MLILSRKRGETIEIEGGIRISVLQIRGERVRIGVEAPRETVVLRGEIVEANQKESNS